MEPSIKFAIKADTISHPHSVHAVELGVPFCPSFCIGAGIAVTAHETHGVRRREWRSFEALSVSTNAAAEGSTEILTLSAPIGEQAVKLPTIQSALR